MAHAGGRGGAPAALLLLAWTGALLVGAWRSKAARPGLAVVALFATLTVLHAPLFHAERSLARMLGLGAVLASVRESALGLRSRAP